LAGLYKRARVVRSSLPAVENLRRSRHNGNPPHHLVDEREQLMSSGVPDPGARPAVMLMRTVSSRLVNHLVSNRLTERGTGNDVAAIVDASPDARLAGFLGKRGKRRSIARE
jgi:hypothetical protein